MYSWIFIEIPPFYYHYKRKGERGQGIFGEIMHFAVEKGYDLCYTEYII
jgi:hypothetical protein